MKKRYTLEQKKWDSPIEHAMPAQARVPASFNIGNVPIAPATVLAPMAGVTDTVFRRFIKNASQFSASSSTTDVEATQTNQQSGCGLIMTEFTSADGLSRMRETKRKRYLTYYDDEHPIAAQLFGSNPETLADSARIVQDAGFDIVDLNLGCPAKRVVACNGGSGLLKDLPQIERIFKAIRATVTIPFTVKFRMGWNDAHIVCVELAKLAEDNGLNACALHARTREDGYTGQARWEYIAAVKDAVRIPVIGNGDIESAADVQRRMTTGVQGVMIGRAAMCAPWIFREIKHFLATGTLPPPLAPEAQWAHILRHCRMDVTRTGSELHSMQSMRTQLMHYSRGMAEAKHLRAKFSHVSSLTELERIAADHLTRVAEPVLAA